MKTTAVIQARMGSTRLPGKTLMMLSSENLLGTVINSVSRNKFIDTIIVATSTLEQDNAINVYCDNNNIECIRDDSENVLSRFILASKALNNGDTIVRVTADNPINNHIVSEEIFNLHIANNSDYSCIEGLSHTVYEYINVGALVKLSKMPDLDESDKEHVTMYFRKHPEKFRLGIYKPEDYKINTKLDKLLTIDSKEDFIRFQSLKNQINIDEQIDFNKLYKIIKSSNEFDG